MPTMQVFLMCIWIVLISFQKHFRLMVTLGTNYGKRSNNQPLPFIKPFSYLAEINYSTFSFNASIQLEGNGNQNKYSSFYGEGETSSYNLLNLNLWNIFYIKTNKVVLKYGIENILDTTYSTFADWNNIPRKGRNMYVNLSYLIP